MGKREPAFGRCPRMLGFGRVTLGLTPTLQAATALSAVPGAAWKNGDRRSATHPRLSRR
jgi:hypothetical protein